MLRRKLPAGARDFRAGSAQILARMNGGTPDEGEARSVVIEQDLKENLTVSAVVHVASPSQIIRAPSDGRRVNRVCQSRKQDVKKRPPGPCSAVPDLSCRAAHRLIEQDPERWSRSRVPLIGASTLDCCPDDQTAVP
jgi:hypothetical protein